MGGKIKVWRCDVCFTTPCLQAQNFGIPLTCLLGVDYNEPVWKETGDFEIMGKESNVPDIPEVPPIPEKLEDFPDGALKKGIENLIDERLEKEADEIAKRFGLKRSGDEKELDDFFEKLQVVAELKQTPNCAVCRWRLKPFTGNIKDFEQLNKAMNDYAVCDAQAGRSVQKVYNTEECKALFEPVEEKSCDPEEDLPREYERGLCIRCTTDSVLIHPETRICGRCDAEKTPYEKAEYILKHCMQYNQDLMSFRDLVCKRDLDDCVKLAETTPYSLEDIKTVFWSGK